MHNGLRVAGYTLVGSHAEEQRARGGLGRLISHFVLNTVLTLVSRWRVVG